jgi:hypothetical protein
MPLSEVKQYADKRTAASSCSHRHSPSFTSISGCASHRTLYSRREEVLSTAFKDLVAHLKFRETRLSCREPVGVQKLPLRLSKSGNGSCCIDSRRLCQHSVGISELQSAYRRVEPEAIPKGEWRPQGTSPRDTATARRTWLLAELQSQGALTKAAVMSASSCSTSTDTGARKTAQVAWQMNTE